MRIALLITAVAVACGFASPAAAEPALPTCLIANGGGGGHFTQTLTCVELLTSGRAHAASGRYSGDAGQHTLTVSLEYQRFNVWLPAASVTTHGPGQLTAMTKPVPGPPGVRVRACVTVAGAGHVHDGPLCTSA